MNRSPIFKLPPLSPVLAIMDPEILCQLEPAWMAAARALPEPLTIRIARLLPQLRSYHRNVEEHARG